MQKVTTYLWFNKDAEAAMNVYVEVFNGAPGKQQESRVLRIDRFPDGPLEGPMAGLEGKVANGAFELAGQRLMAFDGGPTFTFNEAISLFVECDSQEEVDYFWDKLSHVPAAEACGWLKDAYGLSWQIVPKALGEMMTDPDPQKVARVTQAMLAMKKLDIAELQRAFNGE